MITNPKLLRYVCITKGTVVLAEFSSKEPGIEAVALRCIENTPPNHSMFTHTVRNRTYTFMIDDPFVYFSIIDDGVEKSENLWLLNRLKSTMENLVKAGSIESWDNLSSKCLQSKIDPVFALIIDSDLNLKMETDLMGSTRSIERNSRNPSMDSSKGGRDTITPLLGMSTKMLKKKKRLHIEKEGKEMKFNKDQERKSDLCGERNNGVIGKELKNGLLQDHHRKKAKQIWRKHLWVVLIFDVIICALLFGIWLWICQGFECIQS